MSDLIMRMILDDQNVTLQDDQKVTIAAILSNKLVNSEYLSLLLTDPRVPSFYNIWAVYQALVPARDSYPILVKRQTILLSGVDFSGLSRNLLIFAFALVKKFSREINQTVEKRGTAIQGFEWRMLNHYDSVLVDLLSLLDPTGTEIQEVIKLYPVSPLRQGENEFGRLLPIVGHKGIPESLKLLLLSNAHEKILATIKTDELLAGELSYSYTVLIARLMEESEPFSFGPRVIEYCLNTLLSFSEVLSQEQLQGVLVFINLVAVYKNLLGYQYQSLRINLFKAIGELFVKDLESNEIWDVYPIMFTDLRWNEPALFSIFYRQMQELKQAVFRKNIADAEGIVASHKIFESIVEK